MALVNRPELSVDWTRVPLLRTHTAEHVNAMHRCSAANPDLAKLREQALRTVIQAFDRIFLPAGYTRTRNTWHRGPGVRDIADLQTASERATQRDPSGRVTSFGQFWRRLRRTVSPRGNDGTVYLSLQKSKAHTGFFVSAGVRNVPVPLAALKRDGVWADSAMSLTATRAAMIRTSIAAAALTFAAAVHADDVFVRSGNYRLTHTQVGQYMELVQAVFDTRFSASERDAIADYLKIEFNRDPPASVKSWQNVKQAHAQLTNAGPLQHLRTRARVLADFHCAFIAGKEFHSHPGKAFADLLAAKDPLVAEDCVNKKVVTRQSFAAQARTEALVAQIAGVRAERRADAKLDQRALRKLDAEARSQFTDAVVRAGVTARIMAAVPKAERERVGDALAGALRQTNSLPAVARELESEVMRAVARVEQRRVGQSTAANKHLDVMGYGLSLQMMTGVLHPGGMAVPSGQ